MIELKNLIKGARAECGLSQRELARRTNINNALISRIEKGEVKKPRYEVLKKISDELNINLIEILISAKYDNEELFQLGLVSYSSGIKGSNKMQKYLCGTEFGSYIDVIKVLKDYKNNKLTIAELFGLLMMRTGIDFTKYVHEDEKKKYGLDDMTETKDKNEK